MTYYTLAVRHGGTYDPEFGDYDQETVVAEAEEYLQQYPELDETDIAVLETSGDQKDIDAEIARINVLT